MHSLPVVDPIHPTDDGRPSVLGLYPEEIAEILKELGQPAYRATQVFQALHRQNSVAWDELTTLPRALRTVLEQRYEIRQGQVSIERESRDGTRKQLLSLPGGASIETVAIPATSVASGTERLSVCVSTQAGCAMACSFCATGKMGLLRNLGAAEIVQQVYGFRSAEGPNPTHVVFMGMGEPLANYEATVRAVRLLSHPDGNTISQRRITVSTSGLVPQIRRLAGEDLEITLAISLHAATDELRSSMMPINRRWPIAELMKAADEYTRRTHRRISYEYVLLAGVNDQPEHADALIALLTGRLAHVNLIPYNATDSEFRRVGNEPARLLRDRLIHAGLSATIRASRGQDIAAACGQLITETRRPRPTRP